MKLGVNCMRRNSDNRRGNDKYRTSQTKINKVLLKPAFGTNSKTKKIRRLDIPLLPFS
jgi:hypothetical protein